MVQQFSKSIKITISLFRPLTLDIPERFGPCLFIMLTASLRILNCCISIASEIFFIDKFRNILRNDAIKSDFSEHCICKLFPEGFGSGHYTAMTQIMNHVPHDMESIMQIIWKSIQWLVIFY